MVKVKINWYIDFLYKKRLPTVTIGTQKMALNKSLHVMNT